MLKWFDLKEILVFLLFIGLVCLFFPELVLFQKIPNCGDVNLQFYPQFHFLSYWLKQGIVPLWNPNSFSGMPIYADPQSGFCYPFHLAFFGLLNPGIALGLDLAFHFLLAGWFTYFYLRQIGLQRYASILGGICFMFSGFLVPKILIPALVFSAIYLPMILLGIERFIYKPSYTNFILLTIGINLLLLSGYPQYLVTILLFSTLYAVLRIIQLSCKVEKRIEWPKLIRVTSAVLLIVLTILSILLILFISIAKLGNLVQLSNFIISGLCLLFAIIILISLLSLSKFQWDIKLTLSKSVRLLATIIIAILLGAIYLLPAYEFYQQSTRQGLAVSDYVRGIFFWENLPIIVHDLFAGKGMTDFELSGFIGTTALFLILFSLGFGIIHQQFRKYTLIFWIFILISGAIVFVAPQMQMLIMRIPIINHFFVFHRYLLIFVFALSALAGIALHNITEYFKRQTPAQVARINYSFFIPLFSIILLLSLLFELLYQTPLIIRLLPGFGILLIYFITNGQGIIRWLFPIVAIFITLFELHPKTVGYPLEYVYPEQIYPTKTVYTTVKEKDADFYRISTVEDEKKLIQTNTFAISHGLIPNVAMVYQVFDAQGYNPIMLQAYREYIDYLNTGNPQRKPYEDNTHFAVINSGESKLLDLLNVKYIFTTIPLPSEKFAQVFQANIIINKQPLLLNIYRNLDYLPHAYIVHRARVCKNLRSTLRYISDAGFDPKTTIILNENFGTMVEKQENLIGKTKLRAPRPITVISSPQKASIQIDSQEINDNLPGYNVAVLNPDTRELDDVTAFGIEVCIDTTTNQFVQYLNAIPEKRIIILAWKGTETPYLTEEISSSFRSFGGNPEEIKGNTFALIGVKGANSGDALQSVQQPFAELTIPYPLDVLYRYDEEKPFLPEPENAEDTTQQQPSPPEIQIIKSQVDLVKYTPNRIIYNTVLFQPGFMVLSEIYYPGWQAFIDGKPTRILKANSIFRTVYLNPGKHQIEFRYLPMSLIYGAIISILTISGLIIFGVVRLKRKKVKE